LHPQCELMYYDRVTVFLERNAMPIHQVELTPSHARFISKEVKSGRFRDESSVLEAGLRLLEEAKKREQQKIRAHLRSL